MNSCKDCIKSQANIDSIAYIRFSNTTDIMIVACPKHLAMLKDTILKMEFETIEQVREFSKQEDAD